MATNQDIELFVPGRVCLFGGEWVRGTCLHPHPRLLSPRGGPGVTPLERQAPPAAGVRRLGWCSFASLPPHAERNRRLPPGPALTHRNTPPPRPAHPPSAEHTDWAGSFRRFNSALRPGRTIVTGTNAGLFATVRAHPSSLVLITRTDKGEVLTETIPMQLKALLEVAQRGGFWSYAAGVAYRIATDYRVGGLVVDNHTTTLPLKKGLSSSAA